MKAEFDGLKNASKVILQTLYKPDGGLMQRLVDGQLFGSSAYDLLRGAVGQEHWLAAQNHLHDELALIERFCARAATRRAKHG